MGRLENFSCPLEIAGNLNNQVKLGPGEVINKLWNIEMAFVQGHYSVNHASLQG